MRGVKVDAEGDRGGEHTLQHQRVVFPPRQGHRDGQYTGDDGDDDVAPGDEDELPVLHQQGVWHHVQRGEKERHRQQPAERHQHVAPVKGGHRPGKQREKHAQQQAEPEGEMENAIDLIARQRLVLDDARGNTEIRQNAKESRKHRRNGHDAIIIRRQDTRQDHREAQLRDDIRITRDRIDECGLF